MASLRDLFMEPYVADSQLNSNSSARHSSLEINPLEMETTPMPNHGEAAHQVVGVGPPSNADNGISLTWEDLWVTVPDAKGSRRRPIIQGLTGYAQPGEVLAIMGPSGCGKSTLLDALAGRLGANTRQSGDILINGRTQTLAYGTSAYVTQDETLITTLTVKEAVYYSAQLQLPNSMTKSEKKERAEMTIREMGLQDSMNTRIGGWGAKGLSGGQKRRVSICIEILTRPKLLFLDEPTSGLDSAASYYVMSRITKLDQREGRTIITSIHQPSSEVFGLFTNLCLLSSGRVVYFGCANATNEFFASNGFPCPTLQNPSDHFLRTINKDFDEDIEQGSEGKRATEEVIEILITSFKSSDGYQEVKRQVSKICKQGGTGSSLEKSRSHASFFTQCLVLTKRSSVNMSRDLGYYWLRLAIYVTLSLGVGTIFYDIGLGNSSIQARGAMLMFIASFLTFMTIGGFPSFVEDMKVFERERLNGHYGTTAFVIANTLSAVPYLLLISLIPGALAYYLSGLRPGFEHFLYFDSVLFTCMVLVESLMMIVASIVPNFLMGIITGAGIQGIMILGGGFFRLPNDLPKPFWKYPLHYIAFHKYAYQGMYKNEFQGLTFPCNQTGQRGVITGEYILKNKFQVEMGYSKWVDLGILLSMAVLYRVLFLTIIKIVENMKPAISKFISHDSFFTQCLVLTKRSSVNMSRDVGYYWLRLAIYITLAVSLGTLYYDVGMSYSSIQPRGALLMFLASFLTFMAIGGFPSFVEDMKSLMMTVASIVPNFLMGIIAGGGIRGLMMLGSGFFRLPNDLPKLLWKYQVYYIAFHKYAYQGLCNNDYERLYFSSDDLTGGLDVIISGEEILRDEFQVEMGYSKWVDLGILLGMVVVYRTPFFVIIRIVEKAKPVISKFIYVKPQPMTQVMENQTATAVHMS
ncbi:hypothetical protein RHSIM_Rhsim11G0139200 [Rhododendron simsii]|uniref:ABC transporter domain-containing protein n=1 Tax=Rhododendron simsii TaxID=118357 RepID=A0A834GB42_RHOSS|nr:hypothetical protein RHSIM_Rhsim11G0139200 [Rhododendron simsii]